METKITIHECFQCHYSNKFYNVPYYVKGKKCKRCHRYNYFNAHTKHIRKIIDHHNNNLINSQSNLHQSQQNINPRSNGIKFNETFRRNMQNNQDNHQSEIRNNLIISRPLQQRNRIENNNNQDYHHINIPSTNFNVAPPNFSYYFNTNRNNNNENFFMNFFGGDLGESNNINNNIIKYSWLKKEKYTFEIINKYGSDNICSICIEKFKINEDIHISKCNHLFHYKCIETSITKNSIDCPICRCNLKDGSKKQVVNNNRIYVNYNLNANANNNNFDFDNINNRNRNGAISSNNNRNNHNYRFCLLI